MPQSSRIGRRMQCTGPVLSAFLFIIHMTYGCDKCKEDKQIARKKCDTSEFGFPEVIARCTERPSSGLAASRKHIGFIYSVIDAGASVVVNVLDATDGSTVGRITISGAINVDWEDIAVGVCQDDTIMTCLYILDAGDETDPPANNIYMIKEPDVITGDQTAAVDLVIDFSGWEVNGDDCCTATLFIDPEGNLYFFTRAFQGINIALYKLVINGGWTAIKQTTVTMPSANTGPDAADLNASGDELLVLFHDVVYHFCIKDGDIKTSIQKLCSLPYIPHPCGSSIAWAADECGFYTSTETPNPQLRFSDRFAKRQCENRGVSSPSFSFGQVFGFVDDAAIQEEITGIAFSRDHPELIYAISDGTTADKVIHVIQASNGYYVSTITLTGVDKVDWQDMDVAPVSPGGVNYIYILDAGGPDPARKIILFPEPSDLQSDQTLNLASENIIEYDTTVGVSHALGVNSNGQIYILDYQTEYGTPATMYEIVDNGGALRHPEAVGSFLHFSSYPGPESMSIAPDNSFILIKDTDSVWVYPVLNNNYQTSLANVQPFRTAYTAENRGLSITICIHSVSYYTLSSKHPFKLRGYRLLRECPRPPSQYAYW